jgi:hypothetical protein
MRNLEPAEIYDQVIAIDKESRLYYNHPLSNIVFMGMGEPLMNYNNVLKAIDMITSEEGLGMSPKRITVSTSGVPKMIKKLADDEVKFKLAVSLHSAIDEIRSRIMPFSANFPLTDLRESLEYWYQKTKSKITYEYVVWKDINDDKKLVNATTDLKTNLKGYLEPFRMVTDAIIIKDAYYINLGLNFDITIIPGLSNNQVLTDCITALTNYFNVDKWQINQPIILSDVNSILLQIKGVQSVVKIQFTNKSGGNYSPYSYDVAGAFRSDILYPSLDPAVFEIRYPELDIQGRVITF